MPKHDTITRLGHQSWQCDECGAVGSFGDLVNATDCPSAQPLPLAIEDCPTCNGGGQVARWLLYGDDGKLGHCACPTCNGGGVVTVAKAAAIRKFNQQNP